MHRQGRSALTYIMMLLQDTEDVIQVIQLRHSGAYKAADGFTSFCVILSAFRHLERV